jgi:pimeloyl-ACP methyl ester carboxylesterase
VDQDDGSVSLACDPRLEASLYSMQPLHFSDQELQQPTCPIRLHWADRSKMCFVDMFRAIESKAPTIYTVRDAMPGLGHLVVMEKPSLTAERVLQELQQLEPYAQAAARL